MEEKNILPQSWEARFFVMYENSKGVKMPVLISTQKYAALTFEHAMKTALNAFEFAPVTVIVLRLMQEEGE